jgi:hypothetical protein
VKSEPPISRNPSPEPHSVHPPATPAPGSVAPSPRVRWLTPQEEPTAHLPMCDPPQPEPVAPRRSTCGRQPPGTHWIVGHERDPIEDAHFVEMANVVEAGRPTAMPRSYASAMKSKDSAKWHEAAQVEMDHHKRNGTWRIVKAPPSAKVIASM